VLSTRVWLLLMCHVAWLIQRAQWHEPPAPRQLRRQRPNDPQPFAGLAHKPHCPLGVHEADHAPPLRPVRPDPMPPTNRRPREVDTALHVCSHVGCDYRGWLGLGNLRANGTSAPMDFLPLVKPNLSHFLPHLPEVTQAWKTAKRKA